VLIDLTAIDDILARYRVIAMVGLSPKEARPSNQVGRYLLKEGFRVIPVNPGHDAILGLRCYPDLASIPEPVEVVNLFRNAKEIPPLVEQAIRIKAKAVWMQIGIVHEAAARQAVAAGLTVVMDRCIKIEHERLRQASPGPRRIA